MYAGVYGIQFQWKVIEHFQNRIKKYGVIVQKSLLDTFLFFTHVMFSYYPNLRAIEQIHFDL